MGYDSLGRMTSEQEPFGMALTMGYDANNNRTLVQDSLGGTTTSVFDALNRQTSLQFGGSGQTTVRIDQTYTARDQVATQTRYTDLAGTNAVGTSSYLYDPEGRLTSLQQTFANGSVLASYSYSYDNADRLTSKIDNGTTTSYSYNKNSELTQAGSASYSYDSTGNRTMTGYQTGPGNQLLNDGTWTYTYDNEGNLIEKSQGPSGLTWYYTYDLRNRMTTAVEQSSPGGTTLTAATYVYDVFDNLIEQDVWTQSSGTTTVTRYAYDGTNAWAQLSGTNSLEDRRLFLDAPNEVAARIDSSGNAVWYLADNQGSIRDLVNYSGTTVLNQITYDAYGQILSQTNVAYADPYGYTGLWQDAATGLLKAQERWYNPATGLWETQDPISLAGGLVKVDDYVGNDPTNFVDPLGLWGEAEGGGNQPNTTPIYPVVVTYVTFSPEDITRMVNSFNTPSSPGWFTGLPAPPSEAPSPSSTGPASASSVPPVTLSAVLDNAAAGKYGELSGGQWFAVKYFSALNWATNGAFYRGLDAATQTPVRTDPGMAPNAPAYVPTKWFGGNTVNPGSARGIAAHTQWAMDNYGDVSNAPPQFLVWANQYKYTPLSDIAKTRMFVSAINFPGQIGDSVYTLGNNVIPTEDLANRLSTRQGLKQWESQTSGAFLNLALLYVPGGSAGGRALSEAGIVAREGWTMRQLVESAGWLRGTEAVTQGAGCRAIETLATNGMATARSPVWSSATGDVVVNGANLPGTAGVQVGRRLTVEEMKALTQTHGVEFSLVYQVGPGRNGGGGTYWLCSGTVNDVDVPIGANFRWIYHTHAPPASAPYASGVNGDQSVLGALIAAGSPQRSSVIIPVPGQAFRFDIYSTRLP
jgi:RHS repeat-associated protein